MNKLVIDAGKIIKYKRKAKGYSTQELAKLLNVSPGLINNIENAKNDTFNIELLYKVSNILDIPVIDIISYNLDNIFNNTIINGNSSSSFQEQIKPLFKALTQFAINTNYNSDKLNILLEKLINEINYYNKINSL